MLWSFHNHNNFLLIKLKKNVSGESSDQPDKKTFRYQLQETNFKELETTPKRLLYECSINVVPGTLEKVNITTVLFVNIIKNNIFS